MKDDLLLNGCSKKAKVIINPKDLPAAYRSPFNICSFEFSAFSSDSVVIRISKKRGKQTQSPQLGLYINMSECEKKKSCVLF